MLTVATADREAKEISGGLDTLEVYTESRYSNAAGRRVPQYAATHVRTEARPVITDPALVEPIRRALASLAGAVASGTFLGDWERNQRPHAWVIRELEGGPSRIAVTQDAHSRVCEGCRRRFTGRADARYCSNACRQRAYRQRERGNG